MKSNYRFLIICLALGIALGVLFVIPGQASEVAPSKEEAFSCADECLAPKSVSAAPVVISIVRTSSNPTDAERGDFMVTFSEPVKGVDIGDFAPVVQGVGYALVADVSGFGPTYIVSVYTGYGDGTLGLSVVDYDLISNADGETLGGVGLHNGDFTGGEAYTIVRAAK